MNTADAIADGVRNGLARNGPAPNGPAPNGLASNGGGDRDAGRLLDRPLRRDAARNRELVLDAARQVLAECGVEATMEVIAARAGVGIGTVYRNFPTKQALVEELVRLIVDDLVQAARRALLVRDGTGLEQFLQALGRCLAEHHTYAEELMGRMRSEQADTLRELIRELHALARQSGEVGPDITVGDVMATVWALRGVIETAAAVNPQAWQRHLAIHLAGLRDRPSSTPLPRGLTRAQLATIAGRGA